MHCLWLDHHFFFLISVFFICSAGLKHFSGPFVSQPFRRPAAWQLFWYLSVGDPSIKSNWTRHDAWVARRTPYIHWARGMLMHWKLNVHRVSSHAVRTRSTHSTCAYMQNWWNEIVRTIDEKERHSKNMRNKITIFGFDRFAFNLVER